MKTMHSQNEQELPSVTRARNESKRYAYRAKRAKIDDERQAAQAKADWFANRANELAAYHRSLAAWCS